MYDGTGGGNSLVGSVASSENGSEPEPQLRKGGSMRNYGQKK